MNVELWVCYAVFDQHSEVLCCSQQRMSVGQKQQVKPYLLYTMNTITLQVFLLRQLGVYFKRAPWDHFTRLDSCGIVLTQPRQDAWVDMYLHSITSFTAEVWAHTSQKPPGEEDLPFPRGSLYPSIQSQSSTQVVDGFGSWRRKKNTHPSVNLCTYIY